MPDAPVQIIANASSSAPTAPVQIAANGSGSTPTAPVQVAANGSGSSPSAPPVVSSASANQDPGVVIGGELDPDLTGYLRLVQMDATDRPVYGTAAGELPHSTRATRVHYNGTRWALVHYETGSTGPAQRWLSNTTTQATPDLAAGWAPDTDSDIEPTGTPTFTLVTKAVPLAMQAEDNAGDGLPARIRVTGTLTEDGTEPLVFPTMLRAPDFAGKPAWTDNGEGSAFATYSLYYDADVGWWYLYALTGGGTGFYAEGDPQTPMTAGPWYDIGGETGTPELTAAPAAPVQVAANGSGSTPAAPVQIAANGSGSTPAAPVQIAANGSGSTPTAPPAIV